MKSTTRVTVDVSSSLPHAPTSRPSLQRNAGVVAVAAAVLFFVNSLVEFRYGLFDGATGGAATANQIGFSIALLGWATALVLLMRARLAARGGFAVVAFSLQAAGLTALVVANVMLLGSGSQDSILYPLGGLAQILGGLLGGIALALPGRLGGWHRFAALAFGVVPLGVAFVLMDSQNLPVESLMPAAWAVLGAALIQDARTA